MLNPKRSSGVLEATRRENGSQSSKLHGRTTSAHPQPLEISFSAHRKALLWEHNRLGES